MAERVCRCLLREQLSTAPLYEIVREVVEALPAEQRADETLLKKRLNLCTQCPQLKNGTCALCGCYVEVRAAKRNMGCPMVPPRWGKG